MSGRPSALKSVAAPPERAVVNVMAREHDAAGATVAQLCVAEKSPSELEIDATLRIAPPVFAIEKDCVTAAPTAPGGKSRPLLANAIDAEAGAVPIPDRERR